MATIEMVIVSSSKKEEYSTYCTVHLMKWMYILLFGGCRSVVIVREKLRGKCAHVEKSRDGVAFRVL